MKTRLWIMVGVGAMLGLSSCNDEEKMFSNSGLVNAISISSQDFLDGDAGNGTRAAYVVDESGFHFSWTQGDTVGIYPVGGDQVAFPISSGEGSQKAQFDGGAWALRSTYSYAAYYPFSSDNYKTKETSLPVIYIGQVQNGNGSLDCLDRFDYQASVATKPDADGNVNIALKHLGSFVRFKLTMPVADTYKSITLKSDKTPFVTSGNFDLTQDSIYIVPTANSSSFTVGLNNVMTTDEDKVLFIYAMLAPTDLSDSEIAITIEGTTYKSYTATITGRNMLAGKAYNYTATIKSGTNINGEDVSWDEQEQVEYEYVDLGLPSGTLWATCNVGANSPEEYGDYFGWGETVPSEHYGWNYYRFGNYNNFSKYNTSDGLTKLELEDDAAYVNWGDSWRMPTHDEEVELSTYCSKEPFTMNGVDGYKFVGPNGNYIFFPFGGLVDPTDYACADDEPVRMGEGGWYWSSTMNSVGNSNASGLCFRSSLMVNVSDHERCDGHMIRPVRRQWDEQEPVEYEYVDLGLSVKWATFNVGATKPEENGDYFAWGETEPYYEDGYAQEDPQSHWKEGKSAGYDWSTYKWCNGSETTLTKYNTKSSYGTVDNKTTLDPEDDVAHVKWGGSWRMPTQAELEELVNNCTWTWYSSGNLEFGGVAGYKVTSNKTGYTDRSIFLPAAGYHAWTNYYNDNPILGHYLSSSIPWDYPSWAIYLHISESGIPPISVTIYYRYSGASVRPVCP